MQFKTSILLKTKQKNYKYYRVLEIRTLFLYVLFTIKSKKKCLR